MNNAYMNKHSLTNFDEIKIDEIKSTLEQLLEDAKKQINDIVAVNESATWVNFCLKLDMLDNNISKTLSPIGHLTSVQDSDELRDVYESCIPLLSEYGTFISQHKGLYERFVSLKNDNEYNNLTVEQKRVVDKSIESFEDSGINLPDDKQTRLAEINKESSLLSNNFSKNVLDATKGWVKHITNEEDLDGIPTDVKILLENNAKERDLDGWVITLDAPSYAPILDYSENRALREEVMIASNTKASTEGPNGGKWDNAPIMDQLLVLRQERAEILGFDNHSELSASKKMSKTTDAVLDFLYDITNKSKTKAQDDLETIVEYALSEGVDTFKPWDYAYYVEKMRKEKYALSDDDIKQYFPYKVVVDGLFTVVKSLYGLTINEVPDVSVWDSEVKYYEVLDGDEPIAGFYLDLFARSNKRGGAWMDDASTRFKMEDGSIQLPIAYLTCNFTPTVDGQSLLTHREVETLFHEFGHGLHHMLTKVETRDISGINGVEWDAVELPSQIMENWCWNFEALQMMSSHHETNEPLPIELYNKMVEAKNYMSGAFLHRQLMMSVFDFKLHMTKDPNVRDVLAEVRKDMVLVATNDNNRWENSFSHIFAGGYSSGYYSYLWALVLSDDAFASFEENGIFDEATGSKFRKSILEMGSTKDAMDLYVDFKGRKPTVDALLKNKGIA